MLSRIVVKIKRFILIILILFSISCQHQNQPQNNFDDYNIISNLGGLGYKEGYSGWDAYTWEHENAIYYISVDNDIMKWTTENGVVSLLENIPEIGGILVNGEWLYYFAYGKPIIYRLNLKNSLSEVFFNADKTTGFDEILYDICGFTLYSGNLYIRASTFCFEYNMDSGELYLLNADISSGAFLKNKFYYVEHCNRTFSIYVTDLKSRETELVRGDGLVFEMNDPRKDRMYDKLAIVSDTLYYTKRVGGAVFLYNDSGEDILIKDFSSETESAAHLYMETDNQYLYFTHLTNILYRYEPNNKKMTLIRIPEDFKSCRVYCVLRGVLYYRLDGGNIKTFPIN